MGGTQTRKIVCEQVLLDGIASIVDDQQCAGLEKPEEEQACNEGTVCAEWHVGPWKPVSKNRYEIIKFHLIQSECYFYCLLIDVF